MSKKKSKQKKAQRSSHRLLLVVLVVVGVVVVAVVLKNKKDQTGNTPIPTSAPVIQTEAGRFFVPLPVKFDIEFRGTPSQPWVDRQRLLEALDLILSLRSSRELQTPHDRAIMRLAQEYKNGSRTFNASYQELVAINSNPDKPTYGRLGHMCAMDLYGYSRVQSHPSILPISLYHELFHGADCAGYLEERFDPTDPTQHEPGAYAAQIRMLLALYQAGYLRRLELSTEESSDAGVLQQSYDAWQALLGNRFASWYRDELAHPDQLPQP